jgi:acyl-homoserine-lactone acylase
LVPWEDLPLYINPPGGYVIQSNDTPDYINLNVALERDTVAPNLPDPRLRLRSQHAFELVHNDRRLGLEDVMELKHSPRMLLAERVLDDLLDAVDAFGAEADMAEAVAVLRAWDRTASSESRGGVLFERWANQYLSEVDDENAFREPWDPERATATPVGVGEPGPAVAALYLAVGTMRADGLPLDVEWGAVHRVIRGDVDLPVSGCQGAHGCFRTLSFRPTPDGRLAVSSGDGWVLAVELGDVPRALSVLAYGQSSRGDSPHHDDQAAMFARGEAKEVAWSDEDIARTAVRRYRPGEEVGRPRR